MGIMPLTQGGAKARPKEKVPPERSFFVMEPYPKNIRAPAVT
jgi:hypothetical protein